jgi:hypothetical protein
MTTSANRHLRAKLALFAAAFVTVLSLGLSSADAALITGSEGRVTITGNDPLNSTGSFVLDVTYAVFDGTSPTDPLGADGRLQIAFVLMHMGHDGETPALPFGRFTVFAPDLNDPVPFYQTISAINPVSAGDWLIGPSGNELDPFGGIAPSFMDIDPPPVGPNRAEFFFQTGLDEANFWPGQHSRLLVVATEPGSLPDSVVLEADLTDVVPPVHGDVIIRLVPEPTSSMLALLAIAGVMGRRRLRI